MNDALDQIWQLSLGPGLTNEEVGALAVIMTQRPLRDGEYLIQAGTSDDSLHVLLEGKLEVVKRSGAGEMTSLAVLREGDLAGELSFVDGAEHTVGLRALCDTVVLSMTREEFERIVDDHPQLVYKVMRAVARSAHRIVHRMNAEFVELSNYVFKQHGRY
jgi:CRP-like cAMP-binding protein